MLKTLSSNELDIFKKQEWPLWLKRGEQRRENEIVENLFISRKFSNAVKILIKISVRSEFWS